MNIQKTIVNVFNLHHTMNSALNSHVNSVKIGEGILRWHKKQYAVLKYIKKIN